MVSTYKTVSREAILVNSGERKKVWLVKYVHGKTVNVDDVRKLTIQHWEEKWNTETSGRLTAKLLPDITRWMERKFGENI